MILDVLTIRLIAAHAETDERTVRRFLRGDSMRLSTHARIARALAELGTQPQRESHHVQDQIEGLELQMTGTPRASTHAVLPLWLDVERIVRAARNHFGVEVSRRSATEFACEMVAMMPTSGAHPKFCNCPACISSIRQGKS